MGYQIDEAKRLVIKAGHELVESGLIARTWGNISARIGYGKFVITPSGRDYMSLTPDDIVVVDIDGNYEGNVKPSSEKGVHAAAYKLRQDVNFVIHTHQVNATSLSILGKNIPLGNGISDDTKKIIGPKIITAKYGLSSTAKLTNAVETALGENPECNHVLMRYHGALCVGSDYDSAFKVAYTLEELSGRIYEHYCEEKLATSELGVEKLEVPEDFPLTVLHARTPYISKISKLGKPMRAYIDDLAQMIGAVVDIVPIGATWEDIEKARGSEAAIFIEGDGAYCYGVNEDEAEAMVMVLEKGCQAAYLAIKKPTPPLSYAGSILEHVIYMKKYSKLKDK